MRELILKVSGCARENYENARVPEVRQRQHAGRCKNRLSAAHVSEMRRVRVLPHSPEIAALNPSSLIRNPLSTNRRIPHRRIAESFNRQIIESRIAATSTITLHPCVRKNRRKEGTSSCLVL